MQVKFNRRLEEYKYILSFDLAKHKSGFALVDFVDKKIPYSGLITTDPQKEMVWDDFYADLKARLLFIRENFGSSFFILKERLPNQAGPRSTIATLQGLAGAHAIFDFFVSEHGLDVYDWQGVHSVSVKAYYKQVTNLEKPQKNDIYDNIKQTYPTWEVPQDNSLSYDISDSVAVVETLINRKWNVDIEERKKELKKELKKAKAQRKIDFLSAEIKRLDELKLEICENIKQKGGE